MNVGDLRLLIEDLPDDVEIFYYDQDQLYNTCIWYENKKCTNHNGNDYELTGIIIETD